MTTTDTETDSAPATVAAVDLGSNSFHLIVAQFAGTRLLVVDRLKDMVRLAAGLGDDSLLSEEVMARGIASLERFGQRLKELPPENVRIVGTNTLRRARNGDAFLAAAQAALGHEIEIISGREEARLIYLGVSHDLEAPPEQRRLVVDIGGGSTEIVVGRQFQPEVLESLFMGCVSMSREFFGKGAITGPAMKAAELAARQELEPVEAAFRKKGWDMAIGASGTIIAVHDVVTALGWADDAITADALKRLKRHLVELGSTDALDLPGLPTQRAPVFPGGVAVLSGLFKALGIKRMQVSDAALREGLLWDLLGRREQTDVRELTIADLSARYHVDSVQTERVRGTAAQLLEATAEPWGIADPSYEDLLRWAAELHEIGMDIAHSQYHKHGSYLLQNLDMPGFSRTAQRRLALLVRAHRRKFPTAEFEASRLPDETALRRLALLLRCAVGLHRSRSELQSPPLLAIQADDDALHLVFPDGWLRDHPMTRLDLAEEAGIWADVGLRLTFSELAQLSPPPMLRDGAAG